MSVPVWLCYALASAAFAALTAILGKLAVARIDADLATALRTLVILVVAALVVTARGQWQRPTELSTRALLALVGSGIATGLSWLCYYRALQHGPASRVAPVDKLSVVLVIVVSVLALGEPFTAKLALGGALVTAGVVLIALP